jgi:protein SCO1/2
LNTPSNSKKRYGQLFAALIIIAFPFVFGYFWMTKPRPTIDTLPIAGERKLKETVDASGKVTVDTVFHTIADFSFVSHMGDTVDQSIIENKVFITDFFFTECPTICIDMSRNMARIQEVFMTIDSVFLLSHTVDPERDSVAKLHEYAQKYDVNPNRWLLLTGEKKALYDMARYSYLISATIPGDGGPDDFIHDSHLVLVDREKRVRGFYDGTNDEDVDRLILDTKKLLISYIPRTKDKSK